MKTLSHIIGQAWWKRKQCGSQNNHIHFTTSSPESPQNIKSGRVSLDFHARFMLVRIFRVPNQALIPAYNNQTGVKLFVAKNIILYQSFVDILYIT